MQSKLRVALIQTELIWENPPENRDIFSKKIKEIPIDTDIIVLPEMFTTGFTMNPDKVDSQEGENTVKWMKEIARERNCALLGSISFKKKNKFSNRLFFIHPNGTSETYDKRHAFTFAGEDKVYDSGTERLVFSYKGFRICPLICYDLRFPVWSRYKGDYDLLIFVANWPEPRIEAWDTLLKARAIENMCYCVGVNRVGVDSRGNTYTGNSAVYDSLGKKISTIKPYVEATEIVRLNKDILLKNRQRFQFLNDRDDFKL